MPGTRAPERQSGGDGPYGRRTEPGDGVRELLVPTAAGDLSGLVAFPAGEPRGLLLALHGAGLHAGYYHGRIDPGASLLVLGASLGFTVWAPDRPGHGASEGWDPAHLALLAQVELVHQALASFRAGFGDGGGTLLVAHSYGVKLALAMAADDARGADLLGVDGVGAGVRYAFDPTGRSPVLPRHPRPRPGDRGAAFGPPYLYPPGTITRAALPLAPVPPQQAAEGGDWPTLLRSVADRIRVPVRLTLPEHDRMWEVDGAHLDELRGLLGAAPWCEVAVLPDAGHNVSLGRVARAHHLSVVGFAERCRLRRKLLDEGRGQAG